MRLSLRAALLAIVAIGALSLLVLVAASAVTEARMEQQLDGLQRRYLPRIGLTERLERSFDRMSRGFQDAAAASELDLLDDADRALSEMLAVLDGAAASVALPERAHLRGTLEAYHRTATAVTRELVDGDAGEELAIRIQTMQAARAAALDELRAITNLDEAGLSAAFAEMRSTQRTGARIRQGVSLACLLVMLTLSLVVARGLVRRAATLVAGLTRFGGGEFSPPIPAMEGELGAIARGANNMAASLQRLDDETQALLRRTQHQAAELAAANRELDAFAYSVSHDLKAPLRAIDGFSEILLRDQGDRLDAKGREHLGRVRTASQRMGHLIEDLLQLSKVSRSDLRRQPVDLSALAAVVVADLRKRDAERQVEVEIAPELRCEGDARLLRILLENVLGNSWKFTRDAAAPRITFGRVDRDGSSMFAVDDNGVGFDPAYTAKLFAPFQRLHTAEQFEGTGIGLATVLRIVSRHGGRVAAEGRPGKGATIFFTIEGGA